MVIFLSTGLLKKLVSVCWSGYSVETPAACIGFLADEKVFRCTVGTIQKMQMKIIFKKQRLFLSRLFREQISTVKVI
jgi:precorrin-4 methylase